MNNISKLIKSKVISFSDTLLSVYKKLMLDEIDAIILIHLHNQLMDSNNMLSIDDLVDKMTLSTEKLSNRVLMLIQKGYIELAINANNQETYSLEQTYEILGSTLEQGTVSNTTTRQMTIKKIVNYLETTIQIPVRPADIDTIEMWVDEFTMEEIEQATLECLRNNRPYLTMIDRTLLNSKRPKAEQPIDEKTSELLKGIYAKGRS